MPQQLDELEALKRLDQAAANPGSGSESLSTALSELHQKINPLIAGNRGNVAREAVASWLGRQAKGSESPPTKAYFNGLASEIVHPEGGARTADAIGHLTKLAAGDIPFDKLRENNMGALRAIQYAPRFVEPRTSESIPSEMDGKPFDGHQFSADVRRNSLKLLDPATAEEGHRGLTELSSSFYSELFRDNVSNGNVDAALRYRTIAIGLKSGNPLVQTEAAELAQRWDPEEFVDAKGPVQWLNYQKNGNFSENHLAGLRNYMDPHDPSQRYPYFDEGELKRIERLGEKMSDIALSEKNSPGVKKAALTETAKAIEKLADAKDPSHAAYLRGLAENFRVLADAPKAGITPSAETLKFLDNLADTGKHEDVRRLAENLRKNPGDVLTRMAFSNLSEYAKKETIPVFDPNGSSRQLFPVLYSQSADGPRDAMAQTDGGQAGAGPKADGASAQAETGPKADGAGTKPDAAITPQPGTKTDGTAAQTDIKKNDVAALQNGANTDGLTSPQGGNKTDGSSLGSSAPDARTIANESTAPQTVDSRTGIENGQRAVHPGGAPEPALAEGGAAASRSFLSRGGRFLGPLGLALPIAAAAYEGGAEAAESGGDFASVARGALNGTAKGVVDFIAPGARDHYSNVVGDGDRTTLDRMLNATHNATAQLVSAGLLAMGAEAVGVVSLPAEIPTELATAASFAANAGVNVVKGVLKATGAAGKDQDGGWIYDTGKAVFQGIQHALGFDKQEQSASSGMPSWLTKQGPALSCHVEDLLIRSAQDGVDNHRDRPERSERSDHKCR